MLVEFKDLRKECLRAVVLYYKVGQLFLFFFGHLLTHPIADTFLIYPIALHHTGYPDRLICRHQNGIVAVAVRTTLEKNGCFLTVLLPNQ